MNPADEALGTQGSPSKDAIPRQCPMTGRSAKGNEGTKNNEKGYYPQRKTDPPAIFMFSPKHRYPCGILTRLTQTSGESRSGKSPNWKLVRSNPWHGLANKTVLLLQPPIKNEQNPKPRKLANNNEVLFFRTPRMVQTAFSLFSQF